MTRWEIVYYIGNKRHEKTVKGDAAAFALKDKIRKNGWRLYSINTL